MTNVLWILLNWMAETVTTDDYLNQWYYILIDVEDTSVLLKMLGQKILQIFSS